MKKIKNKDCYVAFLDILGFSEYVKKTEGKKVLTLFKYILRNEMHIKNDKVLFAPEDYGMEEYNNLSEELYIYIMSDSIILAIKSSIEGSLHFLVKWCRKLQLGLLYNQHLIRGGISKGLFYGDGKINFGKGFISAIELEKKEPYPKIVIDSEIVKELNSIAQKPLLQFEKMVTFDEETTYYIDYFSFFCKNKICDEVIKFIKDNAINKNSSISIKYEWLDNKVSKATKEYEEYCYNEEEKMKNN